MLIAPFVRMRNRLFDRDIGVCQLDVPVLSVGNITTGGTGKTPMVITLAQFLIGWGWRVAIISRGYRRQSRGVVVVSNGAGERAPVTMSGDEPALIAERVPEAIVIVSRRRCVGAQLAIRRFGASVVILDDGFQHRQLARRLDIVMVDAATLDRKNRLLPCGTLREPRDELRRAHVLCAVGVKRADVQRYAARGALVICARLSLDGWMLLDSGTTAQPQGRAIAVCAIAHPERFRATIEQTENLHLAAMYCKNDHHWYTYEDIKHIIALARLHTAQWILTTEKDAVKLRTFAGDFDRSGFSVGVARMSLCFDDHDDQWLKCMLYNFKRRY